ncbi:MAG: sterol desaturase family protein [Burkholderiales bacterium]|jgi:sterol desaturase/sphingolipid hydroxylase (fatty acid hydroxylase superfamily)|nr:sterol desaturase family protein [Burkholderiales bacterium]
MVSLGVVPLIVIPIVVATAALEGAVLMRRRGRYDWRAFGVSAADLVGRQLLLLVPIGLATPFLLAAWQHRAFTVPLDTWWGLALLVLGQEFCYYWLHRASHEIRWFWASHQVHHSPNDLNLSAAYRVGWTGRASGVTIFYLPLAWLGFDPVAIYVIHSLNLLYQFWLHADWIPRLGPLEAVLNTPSHHRVHHAANVEYLDANYGGILIVWDRLFGTFVGAREGVRMRFGQVKPVTTYNVFAIEFREWGAMLRDAARAGSWRERLARLFAHPAWQPDGGGLTAGNLRRMRRGAAGAPDALTARQLSG